MDLGLLTIPDVSALEAATPVAIVDFMDHSLDFINRHGQVVAPATVALTLAQRLVRSWCDADTVARYDELATLRTKVAHLRAIIQEQIHFLRQDRHPHLAKALEVRLNEVVVVPGVVPIDRGLSQMI